MRFNGRYPISGLAALMVTLLGVERNLREIDALGGSWQRKSPARVRNLAPQTESSTKLNYLDYGRVLQTVDSFYATMPVQSAFLTCAVKAHAADAIAQVRSQYGRNDHVPSEDDEVQEQEEGLVSIFSSNFQVPRNVAFLLYGGMYQGVAQHFIFNVLFPQWFPTLAGFPFITVACKVITDITFFGPLISLPASFVIKSAVYGSSDPVREGLEKYKNDAVEQNLLFKYWGLWGPVNCVMFSVVPEHLRIVFMASISFFWLIILSTISSQASEEGASADHGSKDAARVPQGGRSVAALSKSVLRPPPKYDVLQSFD